MMDGFKSWEVGRHFKTDKSGVRRIRDESQPREFRGRRGGE